MTLFCVLVLTIVHLVSASTSGVLPGIISSYTCFRNAYELLTGGFDPSSIVAHSLSVQDSGLYESVATKDCEFTGRGGSSATAAVETSAACDRGKSLFLEFEASGTQYDYSPSSIRVSRDADSRVAAMASTIDAFFARQCTEWQYLGIDAALAQYGELSSKLRPLQSAGYCSKTFEAARKFPSEIDADTVKLSLSGMLTDIRAAVLLHMTRFSPIATLLSVADLMFGADHTKNLAPEPLTVLLMVRIRCLLVSVESFVSLDGTSPVLRVDLLTQRKFQSGLRWTTDPQVNDVMIEPRHRAVLNFVPGLPSLDRLKAGVEEYLQRGVFAKPEPIAAICECVLALDKLGLSVAHVDVFVARIEADQAQLLEEDLPEWGLRELLARLRTLKNNSSGFLNAA